jgi:hypothetical protein
MYAQCDLKMCTKSNSATSYLPGSLPNKIQQFIEATSDTNAYYQRSHSHPSLVNAYIVASFLEEAGQHVPPMKRDAGLRDLAQRLHLWSGDMAMEFQRDALQAIELLEKYIQQSLTTELKFIEKSAAERDSRVPNLKQRIYDMNRMNNEALKELRLLKLELREQIPKPHLEFSSKDLDLHDLSPFIPGFTSARAKAPNRGVKRSLVGELSSSSMKDSIIVKSNICPERAEALAVIQSFRDKVNSVVEEFAGIVSHGWMKMLEQSVEKMPEIQDAFEDMGTKLFLLLNSGGQRDYEGHVSLGSGE